MLRAFVELSSMGGDANGTRSAYHLDESLEVLLQFKAGEQVQRLRKPLTAVIDAQMPIEDMPWGDGYGLVVSERLRGFFEREAPGHAQYLDLQFHGPDALIPNRLYYLMNLLRVVDCIDFAASDWTLIDLKDPRIRPSYHFRRVYLDNSKVPPETRMFRLAHFRNTIVIDTALADALRAGGFTGPQFYDISYSYLDEFTD